MANEILTVDKIQLSESTDELRALAMSGNISSVAASLSDARLASSEGAFADECGILCDNLTTFATNIELLFSNSVDSLSAIGAAFSEADRA